LVLRRASGEIELPGHAEAVGDPGEALAETVIVQPPSDSSAKSRLCSSSDAQSTKKDQDGVKSKACFAGLSLASTLCPAALKRASLMLPSAPCSPFCQRVTSRTSPSSNSET
jgi:hypothetical protein